MFLFTQNDNYTNRDQLQCALRVSSRYTDERAYSESTFYPLRRLIEGITVEWYSGLAYWKRVTILECLDYLMKRGRGPATYISVKLPRKGCLSMTWFCNRLEVFLSLPMRTANRKVCLSTFWWLIVDWNRTTLLANNSKRGTWFGVVVAVGQNSKSCLKLLWEPLAVVKP